MYLESMEKREKEDEDGWEVAEQIKRQQRK